MEEPAQRERDLHLIRKKNNPIVDVSYVELPEKLTHRIDASGILGTIAFLAMIAAAGTVEENPLLAVALVAVFAGCAYLAMKEDGEIR